jgi:hypothetical protein
MIVKALTAIGLLGLSGAASASFVLDTTGSLFRPIPALNQFTGNLAAENITGFWDGAKSLSLFGTGTLTIEYFGYESFYFNTFFFDGDLIFSSTDAPQSVWGPHSGIGPIPAISGLLPFTLCTTGRAPGQGLGSKAGCVDNGANSLLGPRNIGIQIDPTNPNVAWLFWDDSGGLATDGKAAIDDDYDDLIVRLTFRPSQVPEPASMGLLGLGLLGLGLTMRRRKS